MAGVEVPRVKLESQGLELSKLGIGCMGLTGVYNSPLSEEDGITIIKDAYRKGVTFCDTADVYGTNANEILVGKALKQLSRENIQLAAKFGIVRVEASQMVMGELKKLVEEGKVKHIAHAVHPITAVQMEWSLWARDIEEEIVPLCSLLGIGIVPYSPLGRGFFGGRAVVEDLPSDSNLATNPRFRRENLDKNRNLYTQMDNLAKKRTTKIKNLDDNIGSLKLQLIEEDLKEISDAVPVNEVARGRTYETWVHGQGDTVVPIPGTTKIKNLDDNIGSLKVKLTEEDLKEISDAVSISEVAGGRTYESMVHATWKFANTPLPT
ncbi:hypothetical protein EUGRSUZ_H04375 [Eucalyptus grandis]|uniref:NADP-dependent oxidoreductase domain-containing protein n=2 Tax=Eucalyptus grandis TaxID=71139 RepID=A0A059B6H9_EUCGR|nr:hypothetical protein EUGRSUZ_H04375 [Eucalyptus grandis]